MSAHPKLKLSVLMITYNHELFIAQAIESILMQQVNFDYEIVIGEDCSSDQTRAVLLDYKNRHPDKIKLILHQKNVGMHVNYEMVFDTCQGEYIAVLEGDDYWTDVNKLQRQVDLMDGSPDLTECFHSVKSVYQDNAKESHVFPLGLDGKIFTLKDVVSVFFIPTLSIVIRKSAIMKLPVIFHQMTNPDWLIHILCAEKGNIGFIDEVMGVYREHLGGIWSGITRVKKLENTIKSAHVVNRHLHFKYETLFKRRISGWHYEAGIILFREFKILEAARHYMSYIRLRIILLGRDILSRL